LRGVRGVQKDFRNHAHLRKSKEAAQPVWNERGAEVGVFKSKGVSPQRTVHVFRLIKYNETQGTGRSEIRKS